MIPKNFKSSINPSPAKPKIEVIIKVNINGNLKPIIAQMKNLIIPRILFAIKCFNKYIISMVIPIKITPKISIFGLWSKVIVPSPTCEIIFASINYTVAFNNKERCMLCFLYLSYNNIIYTNKINLIAYE